MQGFVCCLFVCLFVFWGVSYANGRPHSQAFLADTVETGDRNGHDFFHCMQISLFLEVIEMTH